MEGLVWKVTLVTKATAVPWGLWDLMDRPEKMERLDSRDRPGQRVPSVTLVLSGNWEDKGETVMRVAPELWDLEGIKDLGVTRESLEKEVYLETRGNREEMECQDSEGSLDEEENGGHLATLVPQVIWVSLESEVPLDHKDVRVPLDNVDQRERLEWPDRKETQEDKVIWETMEITGLLVFLENRGHEG